MQASVEYKGSVFVFTSKPTCAMERSSGAPRLAALAAALFLLFNVAASLPMRVSLHDLASVSNVSERNNLDWKWQRTGFHFQPVKNWMNDPNGPLVYKGVYHLFYQYNPFAAVWGNITWGHAVSRDLIHWAYLDDMTLNTDQWYDIKGVWSGSATFVKGVPVMLYTGWTNKSEQVQCKAVPADPQDPLLRHWVKADFNPILVAPQGINTSQFRDPTTAWKLNNEWRMAVGSKRALNNTGIVLQYRSKDFDKWELLPNLHEGSGSGMWECPDFFPVPTRGKHGVGNYRGSQLKYVVKVSLDEKRWDVYVVGNYDRQNELFVPKITSLDIGQRDAFRYDYGIYYASKSFFDQEKHRRILLGWIGEADTAAADVAKGWSSVQALPRQIWLDESTGHSLLQWPVEELNALRKGSVTKNDIHLGTNQVTEVHSGDTSQVDIEVTFDSFGLDASAGYEVSKEVDVNTVSYCNETFPGAERTIGPFGLHVLATPDLQERTSVFFKLLKFKDGWKTAVCNDLTRSTMASDAKKQVYGTLLTVSENDNHELSLRIIVDHSIVETFAQGGKACITARSYPLLGKENTARLFLFNNGTSPVRVKNLKVWRMSNINIPKIN